MRENFTRVDTKVGQVRVTPTDATHMYVSLGESTNTPDGFTVRINTRDYSGGLHMTRVNGEWIPANLNGPKNERSSYTDRQAVVLNATWDGKRFVEPTYAAIQKVLDVVLPTVAQWAGTDEGQRALADAEVTALERKLVNAQQAVEDKEKELRQAERTLLDLRAALRLAEQEIARVVLR